MAAIVKCGSQPGPFFLDESGDTVTKTWFTMRIREIFTRCGFLQQDYAGHSFRIGEATTAALAGLEDSAAGTLSQLCIPAVHQEYKGETRSSLCHTRLAGCHPENSHDIFCIILWNICPFYIESSLICLHGYLGQ